MNIEQLDHVQELPTGWTRASCHINLDAHNSDQLEAVYNLPRGQIRVSGISFKVQAKRLWEWMAFIRPLLQYVQWCCSDLMSSSCAGDVGSSQEGIGRSRRCNISLYPATSSQSVAERLQGGDFDVDPTKHHYHLVFTILLWPLPLNLLCHCKQWLVQCDDRCLARIDMFYSILHHIHGVPEHSYCVGTVKEQWNLGVGLMVRANCGWRLA